MEIQLDRQMTRFFTLPLLSTASSSPKSMQVQRASATASQISDSHTFLSTISAPQSERWSRQRLQVTFWNELVSTWLVNSGNYIEDNPISFAWACFVMCIGGLFFEVFVHLEGFKIMDGISYGTTIKESSKFSFETMYLWSGFSELKKRLYSAVPSQNHHLASEKHHKMRLISRKRIRGSIAWMMKASSFRFLWQ